MKRILIVLIVVFLSACTTQPTALPTKTAKFYPSSTPFVKTKIPTLTPMPTKTSTSIPTATSMPLPVVIEGKGDQVVNFSKTWEDPTILKIQNSGGSNFIVKNYDDNGEEIDLLVNTIGKYQGVILIGVTSLENPTTRFSIRSSGSWRIEADPFEFSYLESIQIPGSLEGENDNVVLLIGSPDLINFKCDRGYIGVWAYTSTKRSLIVNEVGPYSGQSILPNGTAMLVIKSTGKWSFDVTAK